jgi:hypothetical protein
MQIPGTILRVNLSDTVSESRVPVMESRSAHGKFWEWCAFS